MNPIHAIQTSLPMKKQRLKKTLFVALLMLLTGAIASPAMAAAEADGAGGGWGIGLAILGLGIAAAGGALGQGRAAGEAVSGMARNPGASGRIQTALLLGLAFMESLVIFTWVMVFMQF